MLRQSSFVSCQKHCQGISVPQHERTSQARH
jgi:hypothetical protein